jgi:hypothetical protein
MNPSDENNEPMLPRLSGDGEWAMLEGESDGRPMIVRRNGTPAEYAGHSELPFRLGVAMPFIRPDENGFPDADETAAANDIEDALVDYLEESQAGVLTLVITTSGMREYVCYVRSTEEAEAAVQAAATGGNEHDVQYYVEEDPEWEIYAQFA